MREIINICYITDSNYFVPTLTSIMSVAENCKNSEVNIYVVCSDIKQRYLSILENIKFENCRIFIKKLDNPYLDLGTKHRHVSKTALLKFLLPEIFSDLDKILYLDGDILVYKDLAELYQTDLHEYYAAAVSDMRAVLRNKSNVSLRLGNYFNSGVMLLNLKKMREDNLTQKLSELKQNEEFQRFMDQDVLNKGFEENVIFIVPKYNFQYECFSDYKYGQIAQYYGITDEQVKDMYKKPSVLHLTNYRKPWNSFLCPCFNKWFYYFLKISDFELKAKTISDIVKATGKTEFRFWAIQIKRIIERIIWFLAPIEINRFFADIKMKLNKNLSLNTVSRNKKIIISLTTFPERIKELKYVLYSLFNQTVKADKIVLYLSEEEFKNKENDLPEDIKQFENYGLEIRWVKNLRSYNKLIYALKDFPNDIIVTVDDDIFYDKNLIKNLYKSYVKNPEYIHANRVHKIVKNSNDNILPYEYWIKEIDTSKVDFTNFLTGVGGVLYPPNVFNEEVFKEEVFTKICPYADDIWFWSMGVLNNKKVKVAQKPVRFKYINLKREKGLNDEKTLAKTNVLTMQNDDQIQNVLNQYPAVKEKLDETLQTKDVVENALKKELPLFYIRFCSRIAVKMFNLMFKIKRY